jgi:Ala-tRNA(Pro) deacylase
MPIVERLQDMLERNQVRFTHTIHPEAYRAVEVARAEHIPPHKVAKTIVFHGDQGYGMAVLPADFLVDLQELRYMLGLSHLRLATEEELAELFPDCELGAMPPFGNLYNMPVYADSSLADEETIAYNAGTHRDVVHMKYADFKELVKPGIVTFSTVPRGHR